MQKTFLFLLFILLFPTYSRAIPTSSVPDSIKMLLKIAQEKTYNHYTDALADVDKALAWAILNHNTSFTVQCHREKGYICEQNSDWAQAETAYKAALDMQFDVSDNEKTDIFLDWAILNKKQGHYKIAQEYYEKALSIAEQKQDFEMVGFANNGLATLQGAMSDFEKALKYNLKALEAIEKTGKKKNIVASLHNITIIYLKSKNYEMALKNVEHANQLAAETGDSSTIAGGYATYSKILSAMGNPKAALEKAHIGLKIIEPLGEKAMILEMCIQIAEDYAQLNEFDKAEQYYERCLKYKDYFYYYEHPNFYYKWGSLYLKKHDIERALTAFDHSLQLAQKGQFKDLIQKNNAALAQLYKQKGDFSKAFQCLETAAAYRDSLFNDENARHMTEAQFKYDVAQGEKQIQALQISQSKFWLWTSITIFSLITFSLIYFLRAKAQNNRILKQKTVEIQSQIRRLQESNEILHQFAYASAHDLKEPLRSISSFTSIIQKRYMSLLPPEANDYMGFIVSGVKRMESLLSSLLEYSTILSEQHNPEELVSLTEVLEDVKKNLYSKINDKSALITFSNTHYDVFISRLHLTQLFQNLISNALKFSRDIPQIHVDCMVQKHILLISVRDNGIGIKQEYSEKIFKLFQRLSRAPQYEGTGIGLTICKNIVEKHDGKIWFESTENEGTTFFISLPMRLVQQNVSNTEGVIPLKKPALQTA